MTVMFRTIADFTQAWGQESENTLKAFREMTDSSLGQRATPDTRSLGGLAWHITCSLGEMMTTAGLPLAQLVTEQTRAPVAAAGIVQAYETGAKAVGEAVRSHWTDAQLGEEIPMYGEQWKRGFVLAILIGHQAHHRAQMTILMRMAGLKVPGMYGPSREEWPAYGMTVPD
jgi:uncharacterized damage-inducible protein DinB